MDAHSEEQSLSATLRSFDDETLKALLQQRSDLAVPAPRHFAALATRACTAPSVARALDLLDERALRVLDGLRLVTHVDADGPVAAISDLNAMTEQTAQVATAMQRLRELALVWGPDAQLRLPATLDQAAGPYPAGLGRPAAQLSPESAALVEDAAALRRTVLAASPQARAVLDRLAAGPPIGSVTDADSDAPADTPVRWLITHHLLVPTDKDTVELPREVAVLLRRESGPLGELRDEPQIADSSSPRFGGVDEAGAAQVCEIVRLTSTLLDAMADAPVGELKSGGIGTQGLQKLASTVELSKHETGTLLEAAYSAGLLGRLDGAWLPSHGYDAWKQSDMSARWARLARAWLTSARGASAPKERNGTKHAPVLSKALTSQTASGFRREALELLASRGPDESIPVELAVDLCGWRHPRRRVDDATRSALQEAAFLGVTAHDALTTYGRLLLDARVPDNDPLGIHQPETDPLLDALDAVLPPPVDEIIIQSDLTVIVPGFASPQLAAELALVTDAETATSHRVTEASLRRALDSGYAPEDVRGMFARRSRGDLPQTLTYLINDVGRKHGGLRTGEAGAYLRSDDEILLAQVLADRRLAGANLRRLAPTVLVTSVPLTDLVSMLRRCGHATVAEDASGSVMVDRRSAPRAPDPASPPSPQPAARAVDDVKLTALVEELREAVNAQDSQARAAASAAIEVLRDVMPDRNLIWVEYVDSRGDTVRRLVRPVSMSSGFLRAEDRRTETVHTIALRAIGSVTPATV